MRRTTTVWERGRLDGRRGPSQLLFGRMYEDSSIELDAFRPGGRVFCIASAGCTAAQLATRHEVVAVDVNPVQIDYARRRFLGDAGQAGKAEKFMSLVRSLGPLVGWRKGRINDFLGLERPDEQMAYWRRHLDTHRFRLAFEALLSLRVLGSVYAPSLLRVLPKRLGAVLRRRMERCFAQHPNNANPYARTLLLGEFSPEPLPREARHIRLVHAEAAAFLEGSTPGSFDGFTLSNILDGTDEAYARRLLAALKRAGSPGATMVLRSFRAAETPGLANHAVADRSMLWGRVLVGPVAEFQPS